MLHSSNLIQLLVACDAPKIDIHSVPLVENSGELFSQQLFRRSDGPEKNSSPFTFTPQRFRLDKDDEFFADGDVHRHLYLQDLVTPHTEGPPALNISEFQCHVAGCKQLFDTLETYEHHYNSLHRHVCSSCKRSFPSNRLLDIHILEWHDSLFQVMAERECMYQCLVEGCGLKFRTSKERKEHLITTHSYPADFRFDKPKKIKRGSKKDQIPQQQEMCPAGPGNVVSQHGELENCELMETQESESPVPVLPERLKPHYSYKVPPTICFGQGSVRGFRGGRKKK
ncbi:zinc finger protein 511 [Silurus asotus]|uniref:Zinc finger protein 511 n=1 Tax=Silurus asotus TaxID=30991 RepID=A0AAD5FRC7_SILAS|nr:zinc finger protein 511 [Silurus asotus]